MSPEARSNTFQPFPLFPPVTGLRGGIKPFYSTGPSNTLAREGETPFRGAVLHDVCNFRSYPEGFALLENETAVQSSNATTPTLMFSWASSDAATKDIIWAYDNGGTMTLRYYSLSGAAGADVVTMGSYVAKRLNQVPFQGRNLIRTTAAGLYWYNGATRTGRLAGVSVPATNLAAAAGAAGVLTGAYLYVYTNVNDQGHESNPSAVSAVVNPAAQQVNLTSIDVGPAGTSSRRVYRTTASGATYLFLTEIADNVTTTYTDNTADSALGSAVATDNTIPPTTLQGIAASGTRVALLSTDGMTVYFSKIDATTGVPNWEAYPSALSVNVPFSGGLNSGRAIVYFEDAFYVFGGMTCFRIIGDISQGPKIEEVFNNIGLFADNAYCFIPGRGLAILTQNKRFLLISGGSLTDLGDNVQAFLGATGAPSGRVEPSLSYDAPNDCIYFEQVADTLTASADTLIYSFKTKEWTSGVYNYDLAFYSNHLNNYYGHKSGEIDGWWAGATGTPTYSSNATNFLIWSPWTPFPGYDIDFGWIEILIEAKPISSSVVPTIKVTYMMDGAFSTTAPGSYSKIVDIASDFITRTATTYRTAVVRSVRVPIHRVGRTITVRVDPSTDTASLQNGLNIYGINIWARPLREARDTKNAHYAA